MIDKFTIARHILTAKLRRPSTVTELKRLQSRKLARLLKHVKRRVPFYRMYADQPFAELPVLTKREYVRAFSSLNVLKLTHEETLARAHADFSGAYSFGLSTGTTGTRGAFITSPRERLRWTGTIIERCLPKPLWAARKIALFLRADNDLYQTVGQTGRVRLKYFSLTQDLVASARALDAFEPEIIIAPPHILARLAELARARPSVVFSVADLLDAFDRRSIEARFPKPIHEIYQATEGFLGASCAFGRVHLNEDLMLVEKSFLDEEGRFVPTLTDFHRRSQVLVRVRLNDVLKCSVAPCPCGSPMTALDAIEGRTDEVFLIPEGEHHLRPIFRPDILRAIDSGLAPEGDFELRQISPTAFVLTHDGELNPRWLESALVGFKGLLHARGLASFTCDVGSGLARALYAKRRRVVRGFSPRADQLRGGLVELLT